MTRRKRRGPYGLDRNGMVETLRSLVDGSEMTRYAISQKTAISESVLSKCYNGGRVPTLDTVQRVAKCVGAKVRVQIDWP